MKLAISIIIGIIVAILVIIIIVLFRSLFGMGTSIFGAFTGFKKPKKSKDE